MKKIVLLALCAFFSIKVLAGVTDEFITIWKTDNPGQSNSNAIRFCGQGNGYTIIWEEVGNAANSDTVTAGLIGPGDYQPVTFPSAGTYRLRVDPTGSGTFTNFRMDWDEQKILDIEQWGTTIWTDLAGAFRDCYNLDVTASDAPDLSNVTSLAQTFSYCYGLIGTPAFNTWQTGAVTDMSGMFWAATQFNQDLNNWNTSNVTNMFNMFENADLFNGNISTWNTSAVTNMASMFKSADNFNQPIGNWVVSSVTTMTDMFRQAGSFNQSLSGWNTISVTDMGGMFQQAVSFDQDLSTFNTSAVTNMASMFEGATAFNRPIGNWDVSAVTIMRGMFKDAVAFNQPLSNWTTTNVTNMNNMFENAVAFNSAIGNWDVSAVTSMSGMFRDAVSFNQPLNNWNVSAVTNMSHLFYNASSFNQPLNGWNTSSLTLASNLFRGASQFNQPLSNWDVSSVTQLTGVFEDASAFNQDLSSWDLSAIPQGAYGFLNNSGMDCINYSLFLNSLAANPAITSNVTLGALNRIYDSTASEAHDYLVNTKGWNFDGDSYVADCNTALPLVLHDFDAAYEEPYAVLTWQAGQEADLDFYEVEQSFDAVQFSRLEKLRKQNEGGSYTYRYPQNQAVAYYRIKLVDINGETSYSLTRSVRATAGGGHPLTLYPNPAEGQILHLDAARAMQVELFNQLGKSLGKHHLEQGSNTLDISALPAGIYWLRQDEGSQKFVIKK